MPGEVRRFALDGLRILDAGGGEVADLGERIGSGYLLLPPGATLLDMRGARILVAERTVLDVPQMVLYSLEASGTDGG